MKKIEQKGGEHYQASNIKIQPITYILANDSGYCEGIIVKYITRYKEKGGFEDLRKILQYTQFLMADKYPEQFFSETETEYIADSNSNNP